MAPRISRGGLWESGQSPLYELQMLPQRHQTLRSRPVASQRDGNFSAVSLLSELRARRVAAAFLPLAAALIAPAGATQYAQGVVYLDRNANGQLDPDEPGVAEVGVSNGRDVVRTDGRGAYRIAVEDGDSIFVIKPSGYRLPLSPLNLPRFYYVHAPGGSPPLQYAGVAPTGPLPAAVNFALLPGESGERFSIVVVADPQPGTDRELDFLERGVLTELTGRKDLRFGLTLGDLVFGDLRLFEPIAAAFSKVGIPWFNAIGNHDINMDATTQVDSEASFNRVFGPSTYAFDEGRVHFIVLNCIIHPSGDPKYYAGGLTEKEFEFVANDLRFVRADRLVVVAMHYPLFELAGRPVDFSRTDRQRLFRLIEGYPSTLSLSGHTHFQSQWDFGAGGGWRGVTPHHHFNVGTASGDWWNGVLDSRGVPDATMVDGTPKGYAFIHFDGVKYSIDYKAAGAPDEVRMRVTLPSGAPAEDASAERFIYVNYFLGSAGTRVDFRVDDGPWRPMERVFEIDPGYRAKRQAWREASWLQRRNQPTPGFPSTHLWKAGMTPDESGGVHHLEVRVTDADGRVFSQAMSYGAGSDGVRGATISSEAVVRHN